MTDSPTLTLEFKFHPSSGMFVAQVVGSEELAFVVSPAHLRGNLEMRLAVLADDTRALAGTWQPKTRTTPPPIPYAETEVRRFRSNGTQIIALEDLDLEI
jgi:hypothetical protein